MDDCYGLDCCRDDRPVSYMTFREHFRTLLLVVIIILLAVGLAKSHVPPDPWERDMVEASLQACPSKHDDPWTRLELLRLEEPNVPDRWRGMVLAAACNESRFNSRARGDCNRSGRLCKSLGLMQIMHFHRRPCGLIRRKWAGRQGDRVYNGLINAACWLHRIERSMLWGCRQPWLATWAWIADGRRSCRNKPRGHLKRMKRLWRQYEILHRIRTRQCTGRA